MSKINGLGDPRSLIVYVPIEVSPLWYWLFEGCELQPPTLLFTEVQQTNHKHLWLVGCTCAHAHVQNYFDTNCGLYEGCTKGTGF